MFAIRIDAATRKALAKAAKAEGNTAAGIGRRAINEWLRERGYLK